ncbi:hypothetical protein J4729_07335 [Leisingera sp. HS039]|uniref:hypothetical protein n=1 Tax=Leisingera sp. HS039 TaxID=2818496 RepID=UPI001B3A1AB4|nr:hypothetical protein [Leisingera sp. HS039]MBQ4824361.1 hypothetical protein [Leisingera sp. HS039]
MANSKCRNCGGHGCTDWAFLGLDECCVCDGSGVSPFELDLGRSARLLIIGHGRHGKDSVGGLLSEKYGMRTVSSSEFAAQKAVFPLLRDVYPDWRACFSDRANHRELWFHAIAAYNHRPGPMLAEQILEYHDIYTGMRRRDEFERSRHLFDLVIWVDAADRLQPEPPGSMELTAADADWIVDNNGPEAALSGGVARLASEIEIRLVLAGAFDRHG